jgi:hypothetical protein
MSEFYVAPGKHYFYEMQERMLSAPERSESD